MPSAFGVNAAHLHLLLNHVPTLGAVLALALLLLAIVRRQEHLTHVGLELLFVIAVVTLPAYVSGVAAHQELRDRPEISDTAVRVHQDAALAGFVVTEFAGFVAWIALWQWRRRGRAARGLVLAATLLLIVALALMGSAATLGGDIRHPEIRPDLAAGASASAPEAIPGDAISRYMVNSPWAWPAAEAIHFLGLSLSIGVLLAVNLRILGVMRQRGVRGRSPAAAVGHAGLRRQSHHRDAVLHRPARAVQRQRAVPMEGRLPDDRGRQLSLSDGVQEGVGASIGLDSSLADKAMAVSSIAAWLAVLYAGRMLPFLGNAF